jgi:hypothetical protein
MLDMRSTFPQVDFNAGCFKFDRHDLTFRSVSVESNILRQIALVRDQKVLSISFHCLGGMKPDCWFRILSSGRASLCREWVWNGRAPVPWFRTAIVKPARAAADPKRPPVRICDNDAIRPELLRFATAEKCPAVSSPTPWKEWPAGAVHCAHFRKSESRGHQDLFNGLGLGF